MFGFSFTGQPNMYELADQRPFLYFGVFDGTGFLEETSRVWAFGGKEQLKRAHAQQVRLDKFEPLAEQFWRHICGERWERWERYKG